MARALMSRKGSIRTTPRKPNTSMDAPALREVVTAQREVVKQGVQSPRLLKHIQADTDALERCMLGTASPMDDYINIYVARKRELEEERRHHPETIAAALANLRLGDDGIGPLTNDPELGEELKEIATHLENIEACIHTVYYALDAGSSDVRTIVRALNAGAVNNITEQIDRLRAAIKGARLKGTRMVVVREEEGDRS